jgi:hypothetical protein
VLSSESEESGIGFEPKKYVKNRKIFTQDSALMAQYPQTDV